MENLQKAKELKLQRCLQSFIHAYQCSNANCPLSFCEKFRRIISHTKVCNIKPKTSCRVCKQFIALCFYQAKRCKTTKCQAPLCSNIKHSMHVQQQKQFREAIGIKSGMQMPPVNMLQVVEQGLEEALMRQQPNVGHGNMNPGAMVGVDGRVGLLQPGQNMQKQQIVSPKIQSIHVQQQQQLQAGIDFKPRTQLPPLNLLQELDVALMPQQPNVGHGNMNPGAMVGLDGRVVMLQPGQNMQKQQEIVTPKMQSIHVQQQQQLQAGIGFMPGTQMPPTNMLQVVQQEPEVAMMQQQPYVGYGSMNAGAMMRVGTGVGMTQPGQNMQQRQEIVTPRMQSIHVQQQQLHAGICFMPGTQMPPTNMLQVVQQVPEMAMMQQQPYVGYGSMNPGAMMRVGTGVGMPQPGQNMLPLPPLVQRAYGPINAGQATYCHNCGNLMPMEQWQLRYPAGASQALHQSSQQLIQAQNLMGGVVAVLPVGLVLYLPR